MNHRIQRGDLDVAAPLAEFVDTEALVGTGIAPETFWAGLSEIFEDLTPINRKLLQERDEMQARINEYHRSKPGAPDPVDYHAFLTDIGYLLAEPGEFTISTTEVDTEITRQAGPQLVVPLLNARFAVNAANARWGSLYDSLYGTDAIPDDGEIARGQSYNVHRGEIAIARGRALLDQVAPLDVGLHSDATRYWVDGGTLRVDLTDSSKAVLAKPETFVGFIGTSITPTAVLLEHHGLHVEIVLDSQGTVGRTDRAGVQDIVLESAVTTIMDLEDSVAAVDADDKVLGYRNWRALMQRTLSETVRKDGRTFVRTMNPDRQFLGRDGKVLTLPGRSLLLIRNVGHLMTTDAVRNRDGSETYEGILDAVMTALGAISDIRGENGGGNSRTGSLYIVKPKMHGPDEVAFAVELFARVEQLLNLPDRSIKIGIMDEERRTTVNLRACISAASDRVVFINTGFLDRTGDEIHTSMFAGAMLPKRSMRTQPFMQAYEKANVQAGLRTGFLGHAQIGKGMWAMPDLMHDMLEQKIAHPRSGASTAWVPSPTAATLHALHYHDIDAFAIQRQLLGDTPQLIDPILVPPLAEELPSFEQIQAELDNNVQSILGYVVRWVDQGVGCSKVPDIHGTGLMEDRATLRISSQLMANWLLHGLISEADVDSSLQRIAPVVDAQNADNPDYEPLVSEAGLNLAFEAARRLIIDGVAQPSGYTEPILHEVRRRRKSEPNRESRTATT